MKGDAEMAALIAAIGGDERAEIELGEVIGRFHARHDRAIRDREAAQLLPLGATIAATRQHCHKSTVYRRVSRFKKVARHLPGATNN